MPSGSLESRTREQVLNGANIAAIKSVATANWEVFQFQKAELIGPGEFRLSNLLRGQFGTDGIMPDLHPTHADFVLLDGNSVQVPYPLSARGLQRNYRVGPSSRGYDDPSFQLFSKSFSGVGLRPHAPEHLRASLRQNGDCSISWVRRSRSVEDGWEGVDVPIFEDAETYSVRIFLGTELKIERTSSSPQLVLAATELQSLNITSPFTIEVAQISNQFGAGPYKRIIFNG